MRGDHAVANGAGHRRAVDVSRPPRHRPSARAREDDVRAPLARELQARERRRIGPAPRLRIALAVHRARPGALEEELAEGGFGVQIRGVAEADETGHGEYGSDRKTAAQVKT